jgi:REP element-mobilizing transposase RayT
MENLIRPQRRSIRLRGYDYAENGAYFVTLCAHRRNSIFGQIADGAMCLNDAGMIARDQWQSIAGMRPGVTADIFVIMPNHMHGVLMFVGARCARPCLGDIVRGYKSAVTGRLRVLFNAPDLIVWQRNYHEHIIRDEASFQTIAEYIQTNPQRWADDTYYIP